MTLAVVDTMSEKVLKRRKSISDDGPVRKRNKIVVSEEVVSAFLVKHEITLPVGCSETPCMKFSQSCFPAQLIALLEKNFQVPSPIQAASWPLAETGKDVLAIAKTGSGKTLGFLLPALTKCYHLREIRKKLSSSSSPLPPSKNPLCLVMAPTRELAIQICSEANKFGNCLQCRAVALYGGAPKGVQIRELQRGCEIIVATPGRMKDMLDIRGHGYNASTSLCDIKILVLDEADRMLDMGFEKEIRDIVWQIPEKQKHQTLMYSATWAAEVDHIAQDLLTDKFAKITVGNGGKKLTANKSVTQIIHVITKAEGKSVALLRILKTLQKSKKCIIFANTKKDVNWITNHIWTNGFRSVDSISGDRNQSQRESVLKNFRCGVLEILVATDVCGRGLDIDGIERVINYDFPGPEDYIHRIGRTGRGGTTGQADSFFTEFDKIHASELIQILEDAAQTVPECLKKFVSKAVSFDSDSE